VRISSRSRPRDHRGLWGLARRRSPSTATLVEKMVAAGMIVLGKTHTSNFCHGGWGTNQQFGTPWNPWDLVVHRTPAGPARAPGWRSGRLAPWAIGYRYGRLVRLPAAWCGVVGLKTTLGRISTYGCSRWQPRWIRRPDRA